MNSDKIEYIVYTNDIQLPSYDSIDENQNDFIIEDLKKKSDIFLKKYREWIDLNQNDKLSIVNETLVIQKFTPWRYFMRKYNNQNRNTLAIYLQTEINIYSHFIDDMIKLFIKNNNEKELYKILTNHYDFIQLVLPKIIYLRNKYNMTNKAIDLRKSLEIWTLKLTKYKKILIQNISNKRFI